MTVDVEGMAVASGICDCHMHFYGDADSYPLKTGAVFDVRIADRAEYAAMMHRVGLQRFVAVQSVVYGTDNRCMLDGMERMGGNARGIAVIKRGMSMPDLTDLNSRGVRGVRAYMFDGGYYDWADLPGLAAIIAPLGWHLQMQFNGRELVQRANFLSRLACPVVIDHFAKFLPPVTPTHPAFSALLNLIDTGNCWIKLSAPYESSQSGAPHFEDVAILAAELINRAPERLVWGSNWPHTAQINPPREEDLLELLAAWAPSRETRDRILCDNPGQLYGT